MSRRHMDALDISAGACNPSGMAHSLVSACRECIDEGVVQRDDAAVRLIVSQLAYVCGVWNGVGEWHRDPQWHGAVRECWDAEAALSAEEVADVRPVG